MSYRVTIECDTPEEARAMQQRVQQTPQQAPQQERPPLRELEPYCYRCESHGCICKRITTGYLVG